jgi:3-hydroxy acid dehydrogenase / malonic semialdehyde reductase
VLYGRRLERLEALKREPSVPVHIFARDVRDRASVEEAVAGLPSVFTGIDLRVNNAGLALGIEPTHKTDLDD